MKSTTIPNTKGPPVAAVVNLQVERQRRTARRMALQTIEVIYRYRITPAFTPCST